MKIPTFLKFRVPFVLSPELATNFKQIQLKHDENAILLRVNPKTGKIEEQSNIIKGNHFQVTYDHGKYNVSGHTHPNTNPLDDTLASLPSSGDIAHTVSSELQKSWTGNGYKLGEEPVTDFVYTRRGAYQWRIENYDRFSKKIAPIAQKNFEASKTEIQLHNKNYTDISHELDNDIHRVFVTAWLNAGGTNKLPEGNEVTTLLRKFTPAYNTGIKNYLNDEWGVKLTKMSKKADGSLHGTIGD